LVLDRLLDSLVFGLRLIILRAIHVLFFVILILNVLSNDIGFVASVLIDAIGGRRRFF